MRQLIDLVEAQPRAGARTTAKTKSMEYGDFTREVFLTHLKKIAKELLAVNDLGKKYSMTIHDKNVLINGFNPLMKSVKTSLAQVEKMVKNASILPEDANHTRNVLWSAEQYRVHLVSIRDDLRLRWYGIDNPEVKKMVKDLYDTIVVVVNDLTKLIDLIENKDTNNNAKNNKGKGMFGFLKGL